MNADNQEIEVRFLEIDKDKLIKKLSSLNTQNCGEDFFTEIIFYDHAFEWQKGGKKVVRLRKTKEGTNKKMSC